MDIVLAMVLIFLAQLVVICALSFTLTPYSVPGNWLPEAKGNESKRLYEIWSLKYSAFWISCFGAIVAFKYYEVLDQNGYVYVCVGLALPLLIQPVLAPLGEREAAQPLWQRYSFKANVWLFIFSHIGNYWYTHYFYTVLKAKYTMPSYRLNDVPLALTFATHFYFTTYHTLSNLLLRKIETSFRPTNQRAVFATACVLAFSYFTAFMETLTISAYPDYSFEDRNMAYTVGSAFYGIYFIVSFPASARDARAAARPARGARRDADRGCARPSRSRYPRAPPSRRSSSGWTRARRSTRSSRRCLRRSARVCSCSSCSTQCGSTSEYPS
jgi:cycloeucalenol cycloisomerase